jgi:hypothetical protein
MDTNGAENCSAAEGSCPIGTVLAERKLSAFFVSRELPGRETSGYLPDLVSRRVSPLRSGSALE